MLLVACHLPEHQVGIPSSPNSSYDRIGDVGDHRKSTTTEHNDLFKDCDHRPIDGLVLLIKRESARNVLFETVVSGQVTSAKRHTIMAR